MRGVRPFIPNNSSYKDINGVVDLQATATGRTDDSKTYDINFSGTGRNVFYETNAIGDITFVGKTENQQLNANITANFEGQPQIIAANVNFADENLPFRAESDFNNTELAPFIAILRQKYNLATDVEITGRATGKIFDCGQSFGFESRRRARIYGGKFGGHGKFQPTFSANRRHAAFGDRTGFCAI